MDLTPHAIDTFKENPTYFLLAFLCAGIGVALAFGAFLMRKRVSAPIGLGLAAAALGALAITCGAIDAGQRRHVGEMVVAMPDLSAEDQARILARADAQAGHTLHFGMLMGSAPLLGGLALSLAALARRRRAHFASAGASM